MKMTKEQSLNVVNEILKRESPTAELEGASEESPDFITKIFRQQDFSQRRVPE